MALSTAIAFHNWVTIVEFFKNICVSWWNYSRANGDENQCVSRGENKTWYVRITRAFDLTFQITTDRRKQPEINLSFRLLGQTLIRRRKWITSAFEMCFDSANKGDDGVLSQIYSCQYAVFTPKAFNRSQVSIIWHTLGSVISDHWRRALSP